VLVAVLVTGFSGCAGTTDPSDVRLLATADRDRWVLPLDPYYAPHWAFEMYAVDLSAVDCMEAKGFLDVPMIPYDPNAPDPATHNAVGRRLFNPDVAAQFGYRWALPLKYDRLRAMELNRTLDSATASALQECEAEAYERLGIDQADDWVAGAAASLSPEKDQAVVDAGLRWRECMSDLGISGLPTNPYEFPTPEWSQRWGLDGDSDGGEDPTFGSPNPEEIDYAVKDAQCRDSSGWTETFYTVEWALQEEYVRENFDKLEKQRAQNETREQLFRDIIAGVYQGDGGE
jgi:hypothetical protein